MLCYGLIYPLLSFGITVWGQSAKVLTRHIFNFHRSAVRYAAGLKQLEPGRDGFRHLKILTVYSLYIQETILYAKEQCSCTVNKQECTYETRNNDYHKYVPNLELCNSKPSAVSCTFYNNLPNIKQTDNSYSVARAGDIYTLQLAYPISHKKGKPTLPGPLRTAISLQSPVDRRGTKTRTLAV
jgi:hypothetical protein